MFAIIKTGGKQYKVAKDDIIFIEKIDGDGKIEFNEVLMIDDKIGTPFISGAKVVGQILEQKKDDKVLIFKKKRRHNYRRLRGHRQLLTVVKITDIKA